MIQKRYNLLHVTVFINQISYINIVLAEQIPRYNLKMHFVKLLKSSDIQIKMQ